MSFFASLNKRKRPSDSYRTPAVWYLSLITCHLLLVTCHLSLVTCHKVRHIVPRNSFLLLPIRHRYNMAIACAQQSSINGIHGIKSDVRYTNLISCRCGINNFCNSFAFHWCCVRSPIAIGPIAIGPIAIGLKTKASH